MTKRISRVFSAWAHPKNAADLDALSQNGWQLCKPGSLRYTFDSGGQAQRHMLDYCPLTLGEKVLKSRLAAFEDADWALIGTSHTGWRYFRKPLDAALPAQAYAHPCARTAAQERQIAQISVLFWLRVPVLLVGTILAAQAALSGKQMVLPAVIFVLVILGLSFKIQAMQERLKP